MLTSSVISDVISLFVTKKCQKVQKIDEDRWKYIDREILHIFGTTWEILMKFSGKLWLVIISKVPKEQGFTLSLKDTVFEKTQGVGQIDPTNRFRIKQDSFFRHFVCPICIWKIQVVRRIQVYVISSNVSTDTTALSRTRCWIRRVNSVLELLSNGT